MANDPADSLLTFVEARFPVGSSFGPTELDSALADLGFDDKDLRMEMVAGLQEFANTTPDLHFIPGGWRVQVGDRVVQTLVLGLVLGATLYACGMTGGMSAALAGALLPNLLSVERVRLTRGQKELLGTLALKDSVRAGTPEELYATLPEALRDQINHLDFLDFLDALLKAGHAAEDGGRVMVFQRGTQKMTLRIE